MATLLLSSEIVCVENIPNYSRRAHKGLCDFLLKVWLAHRNAFLRFLVLRHAQLSEVTPKDTTCIWDIQYHLEFSY
jgi:hypothetical protein